MDVAYVLRRVGYALLMPVTTVRRVQDAIASSEGRMLAAQRQKRAAIMRADRRRLRVMWFVICQKIADEDQAEAAALAARGDQHAAI